MLKKLKRALASSASNSTLIPSAQLEDVQSKFLLHKTTFHGFPPNPTCLAHDPIWSLLFIGTSSGQIYMYGTPGLEIKTEHPDYPINFSPIQHLFPLPEQMQLLSISENNTLHIWSICDEENNAQLIVLNQKELVQGRGKEITACCVKRQGLYFGTADGRLYEIELQFLGITLIDWEEGESTPVISLEICPTDRNFMLCGYRNGLVTLRNVKQGVSVYSVQRKETKDTWGPCYLTGVSWKHNGDGFIACYNNGEIAYWTVSNRGTPDYINTFYESEYNLEAITGAIWTSNDLLVFAGGIPEDLATNPTITLARAREPDELEVTSPICTPSPDCNGDSSPLIERDIEIMREKDTNKLQEPIPSVVEAIRSSSPFSTTSTLERNKNRHSGFYPDCGDITLAKLKSLAINQELDDVNYEFNPDEFIGYPMNNVPPSPIKEVDTPEHTSNGPGKDDSFTTAKEDSFDLSSLELGKISEEMEKILAQLDYTDKQTTKAPKEVRTSGETSNNSDPSQQIGDITETLLRVGDFTRDEDKYLSVNGPIDNTNELDTNVVMREERREYTDDIEVTNKEDTFDENMIDENRDLSDLDPFENDKYLWRESMIHEESYRNATSPHESDLDEVIDSIERLVSRPWVKKMNPWKNEERQLIKFTSSIKGFFVIKQDEYTSRWMRAASPTPSFRSEILVTLLDQELLFIDLTKPEYPLIMPPYLTNLHSSPITCSLLLDNLASVEYKLLKQLGAAQIYQLYSSTDVEWPFNGGEVKEEFSQDLTVIFITGHENGTVNFWDITGGSISLIYCLYTNYLFDLGVDRSTPGVSLDRSLEGVQRGFWDHYAEDPRLKVTSLCCYDAVLAVGGAGGQVLLFELTHELVTPSVFLLDGVLLDEETRIRNMPGLQPLHFKPPHTTDRGYVPIFLFQMSPASQITALEMAHKFSLVAVGCSYGLAVIDVEKRSIVFTHTTFEEGQITDDSTLTRRSSMRQSFRQSFRNLRRAGSGRPSRTFHSSIRGRSSLRGGYGTSVRGAAPLHPAVRQTQQAGAQTVVRCLTFTTTFISGSNAQLCLWAGTSEGSVLRMSISLPSKGNRKNRITEVHLVGKPLYLRRSSPLTRITVLDSANQVQLPVGAKGLKGPHTVLMCSEDYIKIMNLPGMKKKSKERLRIDENDSFRLVKTELLNVNGVMCLTTLDNEGQLSVYSLPDMRLLHRTPIVDPTDVRAQKSLCMTPSGLIIAQSSQLQFQKYSLIELSRFLRISTIGERIITPRPDSRSNNSAHSHKLL